jgi:hypothetical protein
MPPKFRRLAKGERLSEAERGELWQWLREQRDAGVYTPQEWLLVIALDFENQLCQDAEAAAKART